MRKKSSEKITLLNGKMYLDFKYQNKNKGENDMKKLFVSCPMKGRTEENIKKSIEKMHKIAELIFDQELELINSYEPMEELPSSVTNTSVYYLGRSIQKMSKADYFIGIIDYSSYYSGCMIEKDVASEYGIPHTYISMRDMMPDAVEIERNKTHYECETEE